MQHDALSAALLALLQSGEGIPIDLRVTPSREVQQLRDHIAALEAELQEVKRTLRHSEFQRGCEMQINDRLCDLLRQHGIKIPRDTFH